MEEDELEDIKSELAARLNQERRPSRQLQQSKRKESGAQQPSDGKSKISTLEFGMMASFLAVFFDLPQAFLAATLIGVIVSLLLSFFGYLILYIWLKIKGRSLMDAKGGNKLLYIFSGSAVVDTASGGFLPGLSGFVLGMMIAERLEEALTKYGGAAGKVLKSAEKAIEGGAAKV
ncbi:MAG: hypothetical protein HY470_00435 [Candidatus Ryanbacteria bacterium]|nr:hypothetical protein [Candidatus Ryanbacteria bacterium]